MLISRLLRFCNRKRPVILAQPASRGTAHRSLLQPERKSWRKSRGTLSASAALWLARAVGSKGFHLYTSRRWPDLAPSGNALMTARTSTARGKLTL